LLNFVQLRQVFPHADQVGKFTVLSLISAATKFD